MTHELFKPAVMCNQKKVAWGKGFLEKVMDKLNKIQEMHKQDGMIKQRRNLRVMEKCCLLLWRDVRNTKAIIPVLKNLTIKLSRKELQVQNN